MSESLDDEAIFEDLPTPAQPASKPASRPAPVQEIVPVAEAGIEEAFVSALLGDAEGTMWGEAKELPLSVFQSQEVRAIWAAWQAGVDRLNPIELEAKTRIPIMRLLALSDVDRMGATFSGGLKMLRERARLHAIKTLAGSLAERPESAELLLPKLTKLAEGERPVVAEARAITNFSYPEASDPNVLIGEDDYLGRGGGWLFVSHAGAGKSSWIMDACMSWALAEPWMGFKCHGPLKSLIIQAEDSDRYVGKVVGSFAHVHQLNEEKTRQLSENCVMIRLKGVSGPAFFTELKRLVALHKPDLVVINPLYLYADGDITRSEYTQPFLLGLDSVNKEEKFAYILIHHTGKPQAKGNNGKRAEVEDWESVYMGFGSSYLANWPRCSCLLEPVPGATGRYKLKLGKGGFNAGLTKKVEQGAGFVDQKVTRLSIRHSEKKMTVAGQERPVYYWELDDTPEEEAGAALAKTGRPKKYVFAQFSDIFPKRSEKGRNTRELHRHAKELHDIGETAFRELLSEGTEIGMLHRSLDENRGFLYTLAN